MIAVEIEYNTDENNKWVYDERLASGEPLPMVCYGPFETMDAAVKWMNDYPEDQDVYDMEAVEKDYPKGWIISDPGTIYMETHEGHHWVGLCMVGYVIPAFLLTQERASEIATDYPDMIIFFLDDICDHEEDKEEARKAREINTD